ncbi:MAG: CDP-alcohol phosphatidyltransferase family protein [candidate division NC10 bacterium]|nr:CDP-alcohol phosphatidyltransferase family protein [candidate division NC10 bacterium]
MPTLANRLTILRILMAPVIAVLLLYQQAGAAIALFVLAGITDALDGFFARRRGGPTALGMVLDPIADKVLLTSAVVVLTALKELPKWFAIIVVSRDVFLIGGALIMYMFIGKMSIPPSYLGKATTLFQIVTVLLAMLDNLFPALRVLVPPLVRLTLILTAASGVDYVYRGARLLSDQ